MTPLLIELTVGQRWQHKRERWRYVEITALEVGNRFYDGVVRAYVTRNTSRRRQAIKETTLRKEYELVGLAVRPLGG